MEERKELNIVCIAVSEGKLSPEEARLLSNNPKCGYGSHREAQLYEGHCTGA